MGIRVRAATPAQVENETPTSSSVTMATPRGVPQTDNPADTTIVRSSMIIASAEAAGDSADATTAVDELAPVADLPRLRVLILDDAAFVELAVAALEEVGYACDWERVDSREAFLARLSESTYDLILADYSLPPIDGMTALRLFCERQVDIPFIIVSSVLGEERAIEAVKAGATDYVLKARLARLGTIVQRALQEKDEQRERRHAEAALRRSEERFRIVAQATHDEVWDWDLVTDVVERNESVQELFGYTPDQVDATIVWWVDHIHPDDRERVVSGIHAVIDGGGNAWSAEYRFLRGDGSFACVFDRGHVIHDRSGKPVRMIGAKMDISARKQAEEEIRGLNESLREDAEVEGAVARAGEELIEGLDRPELLDRVCRVTTKALGCEVSWAVLVNRERTYYEPVAAVGVTPEEHEEARLLRLPAEIVDPLLAGLGCNEFLQVSTPEGTGPVDPLALRFGIGVTLYVPLRRGGDIIGVLGAGRRGNGEPFAPTHEHIARRLGHLASLALEAARLIENLEHANRLKSEFVATMSHELRTPMNTIMGYNDLLREDAYGPLNDEQRRVFLAMDGSSRQLLDLINATLDISRLDAGRLRCSISEVDLRELLEEVREENRHQDRPDIKIVWKSSHNLARIRTDAVKLKVILKNLLDNAVKFTEAGQVTVEARSSRGGLEVSVTDTGIGIPEDALSFIFEPFRQVESASTRSYGGVGLGLYLVRRLVDLLEGSITVESEVGRGSTFRVWLRDIEDHEDKDERVLLAADVAVQS